MIEIKGLILSNDDNLVGFLVNEDGNECIQTKETIIQKSKDNEILNIEQIRKEIIDGEKHIFIDLDERVTENVLYEVDEINKVYSKKKKRLLTNNEINTESYNINDLLENKVYKLSADLKEDIYDTFHLKNYDEDAKKYFDVSIKNSNLHDIWGDVYVYSEGGEKRGDCAHIWAGSGCLVFSEKAVVCLAELLNGKVELLPLICDEAKYYLINVTNYIDAVDYDRAIVKTLLGCHRIGFENIALKTDVVGNNHIFKVYLDDRKYSTEIFVSEQFKYEVLKNGLTGFDFKLI